MNVIIVDDEPKCVKTLSLLLKNYHDDISILGTAQSAESALELIRLHQHNLDLLFLDIQMPDNDGFFILQNLEDINFSVIFTTAYDKFALKAIKFSALDYLLKPINNEELTDALKKHQTKRKPSGQNAELVAFREMLEHRTTLFDRIVITSQNDARFVSLDDILYLESDNNYTTIHTTQKESLVSTKNIGFYEDLLNAHSFCRVHNSYIVNLKKVTKYYRGKTGTIELINEKQIMISGRRREEVLKKLGIH
ncbi:MAG: LytTR family DNA-binding domain-containing protein [Bacteroidota bacterium]